jgi:hypothetical protein
MTSKYKVGLFLVVVILTASIYVMLPGEVKILADNTKTTFSVWNETKWITGGIEYDSLYNGTKKLTPSSVKVTQSTDSDNVTLITRLSIYSNGAKMAKFYIFNGAISDKEQFPVKEYVIISNGSGLVYQYDAKSLQYNGVTRDANSPESFGRNMKITWEGTPYYHKIIKLSTSGTLTLKYKITSTSEEFKIRLFDPDPGYSSSC